MTKIDRFEDVRAWQLARQLVKDIYGLSKMKDFSKDYAFKDQIQKAAVSVMSNIAEGFERYGNKEFAQFLNISKGSVAEVRSQIYIAFDLKYVSEEEFTKIKSECEVISRHIWNLIKYLKNSEKVEKVRI